MSTIIPICQMIKENIEFNFMTPAIAAGWQSRTTMKTKVKFTDGKVNI